MELVGADEEALAHAAVDHDAYHLEGRAAIAGALAARLVNGYEVNGQTAWALLTKAERFRVCIVSELPPDDVRRMRIVPVRTIEEALDHAGNGEGFIMPRGAAVLPRVQT